MKSAVGHLKSNILYSFVAKISWERLVFKETEVFHWIVAYINFIFKQKVFIFVYQ